MDQAERNLKQNIDVDSDDFAQACLDLLPTRWDDVRDTLISALEVAGIPVVIE